MTNIPAQEHFLPEEVTSCNNCPCCIKSKGYNLWTCQYTYHKREDEYPIIANYSKAMKDMKEIPKWCPARIRKVKEEV